MKTKSQLDMYRDRMQEVVSRLDVVKTLLRGDANLIYPHATVESVYLQFRHVLELIATASLSVNQPANDELRKEGRKKWHAGHILEAVEIVNPEYYYPQPIRLVAEDRGGFKAGIDDYLGEWKDFHGDYLNREKFTTLYNACSRFLHTSNPFDRRAVVRDKKTDSNQMQQAKRWRKRIIELLAYHKFRPSGEPKTKLFVCHTVGPNAQFHIAEFEMMDTRPNPNPADVAEARTRLLSQFG